MNFLLTIRKFDYKIVVVKAMTNKINRREGIL